MEVAGDMEVDAQSFASLDEVQNMFLVILPLISSTPSSYSSMQNLLIIQKWMRFLPAEGVQ